MLVTYEKDGTKYFAFLVRGKLYNCQDVHPGMPADAQAFIRDWRRYETVLQACRESLKAGRAITGLDACAPCIEKLEGIIYDGLFNK